MAKQRLTCVQCGAQIKPGKGFPDEDNPGLFLCKKCAKREAKKRAAAQRPKKPLLRRWWFWALVVVLILGVLSSIASNEPAVVPSPSAAAVGPQAVVPSPESTLAPTAEPSPEQTFDQALGKDISAFSVSFSRSVNNDTTGKWRLAQFSEAIDFTEYALSYYQEFFGSDSEVHFVINRTYGTTTRLNASGGHLFVSTYEYVKGEELDAKKLPSGMLLGEWVIDIASGEIEDISNAE